MASNTENVKVGVCKVFYGGVDLGYTKGGVEVEVTTESYKSEVDQFGKSPISEVIMARAVKATVPLAETTLENLVNIMPGATLQVDAAARKASGTIKVTTNPTDGKTVIVNGVTFTFKTSPTLPTDVKLGATPADTATNLKNALAASSNSAVSAAEYSVATDTVTVTYRIYGVEGHAFTLNAGSSTLTISGAALSGGVDPVTKRVDVTDAVGQNLLLISKELRLHPQGLPDDDQSEDFVIPRAATAGGLQFAYRLEEERIFNCEFNGYPDPASRRLFYMGDSAGA